MKKLVNLFIILLLVSCDDEIHITQPTIIINSQNLIVSSPIEIEVIQSAEVDGNIILPDYYKWRIKDSSENVVFTSDSSSSSIVWTPDKNGNYNVSVEIGYDGNKSIITIESVTIKDSPESFVHRLSGIWTGSANAMFDFTWDVDITIDSTGFYFGEAYNLSDTTYPPRIFFGGNSNGNSYPTDKIVITSISDYLIEGYVVVTHDNLVTNQLDILKLDLANNDSTITLWLTNHDGETFGAEYYTEHLLERQ